jgi:hypothetical protein
LTIKSGHWLSYDDQRMFWNIIEGQLSTGYEKWAVKLTNQKWTFNRLREMGGKVDNQKWTFNRLREMRGKVDNQKWISTVL